MKQRILLTGKDGIDLLQRITTLDFQRISTDKTQPGLILNPQGKILCYFEVKMGQSPDQAEVSFDDSFLELLEQYTFGERYKIENLTPITIQDTLETELKRIHARQPKLGNEFLNNGETNPLEINLNNAIHDQKGCYPGQEVIEKIIAIGAPSKKLCLVKSVDPITADLTLPLILDSGLLTTFQYPYGLAIVRKTSAAQNSILNSSTFKFLVIES